MKYGKETGEDIMDKIDSIEDHLSDLRANSASAIPTILKILFDDTTVEETSNWNKIVKKVPKLQDNDTTNDTSKTNVASSTKIVSKEEVAEKIAKRNEKPTI